MVKEEYSRLNKEAYEFGRLNGLLIDVGKDFPLQAHDFMIIEDKDFKGKILDAGCGPGILSIVAKLKNPNLDISIMDGSEFNLAIAVSLMNKCKLKIISYLSLVGNVFKGMENNDTVVLNHIVEHIDDLDMLFNWVDEITKEHATILIAVPFKKAHNSPNHVHFFTDKPNDDICFFNIIDYLKDRGYKVEYKIFDEEKADKRHPFKSRGQLDMFIKVKK